MKKQTVGLFLVAFLIGQVFVNLDLSKIRAAEVESEASISASQVAQAVLDDSLKVEDLSIKTPRLLPVSPFYFVKDFSRDIQKFFTFDSVKKAELELRFADERLMEVRILAETRPEKQDALKNALELYQNQTNELKDRLENLASKSKNPNIDKLLEKVTDRAIKHEKLFDELISNTKLSDTAKDKIKATQGVYLDVVSAVSKKFDTPTEFSDRLEKVVGSQVQTGSEFNSIRVLEVIDRLETKLPEEVRAKTASIREDLLSQIKVAINETSVTPATSGQILNALPGDKISRAKIMGEIKESEAQSKVKMNSRLEAVAEEFGDGIKDNITKERAALAIKSAETRIGELRRALGISLVKAVPFMDMNGKYVINQNSSNLTLLPGTPIPSGNQGGIPVTVTGTTPIGGANPAPVTPVSTGLYGDKNKALEFLKKAEEKLAEAKQAFNQEKFGEAFGKAVSAEAHARSGLRALAGGEGADSLQGSLEKLINKLNNIKEKIKNLGWTSENKPEVFSLISQAENLLKQAQSLLENKRPDLIDILRQAKEIIFKLERLIKEKPIPSISNTVSGVLAPAGPNIYQWGTHQLKTEGGKIFQVKALNDSVLADLKKYENQQVRIYGKAQFYEIEGGFYGITAEKISLSEVPISLFQVFSPKEGDKLEVGKTYQIKWSPTAANIVSIYLDTGIVCVKAPCPSRVTIAENVPAQNRSYSWTISKDLGIYPKARIVVQYVSNSAMSGYFSIVSFLTQTYSSKYCVADSDCVLLTCAGPFNKEYAKTLPPDLPCTQYLDYQVSCIENKCTAVK